MLQYHLYEIIFILDLHVNLDPGGRSDGAWQFKVENVAITAN